MFIPLTADNEGWQTPPLMTILLIVFNALVFIILQDMDANSDFTLGFSTVAREIVTNEDVVTPDETIYDPYTMREYRIPGLKKTPIPVRLTVLTSMFMHVGWMHLIGNMLFLWVFGVNIEDHLGHFRFLGFYLAAGILSDLAQVAASADGPNALIPTLGASGAISGVLGAFLVCHAERKIRILLFFHSIVEMPAVWAIGIWFGMQMLNGVSSIDSEGGGVAYTAHIVGFIAGGVLIWAFQPAKKEEHAAEGEEPSPAAPIAAAPVEQPEEEEVVGVFDWRKIKT